MLPALFHLGICMPSSTRLLGALLASLMLSTLPARAAPAEYSFDTVHSQILFFVSHLGVSISEGEFQDFEGGFRFDAEDWTASSVEVTVDINSIDMDDERWNKHLLGKDYFNAAEHPSMRFVSTKLSQTGEKSGKLAGELTLLGVTKPVVLDVVFNATAIHPYTRQNLIGFSATGILKRSEFGMQGGLPAVGDDVELRIEVEGVQKTQRGGVR